MVFRSCYCCSPLHYNVFPSLENAIPIYSTEVYNSYPGEDLFFLNHLAPTDIREYDHQTQLVKAPADPREEFYNFLEAFQLPFTSSRYPDQRSHPLYENYVYSHTALIPISGYYNANTMLALDASTLTANLSVSAPPSPPSTSTTVILQKRKRRRKTPVLIKCDICHATFSRRYNLKSHQRTHTDERPFVCEYVGCHWAFARPHDLKRHELLHSGIKPFACDCGKKFSRSDAFKRHQQMDRTCTRIKKNK